MNMLDDVEYFDQSKIINIDDRIRERLAKISDVKPDESPVELRPSIK